MISPIPTEKNIRDFWDAHPYGDHQVDSLKADYEAFSQRYDKFRYNREGHILRRRTAQHEIARVLKPNGRLMTVLDARRSLNYLVAIAVVRRIAVTMLYLIGAQPGGIVCGHLGNARREGLWRYLRMSNFIHRNTDGPENPYTKVYDLATVRADFPAFQRSAASRISCTRRRCRSRNSSRSRAFSGAWRYYI